MFRQHFLRECTREYSSAISSPAAVPPAGGADELFPVGVGVSPADGPEEPVTGQDKKSRSRLVPVPMGDKTTHDELPFVLEEAWFGVGAWGAVGDWVGGNGGAAEKWDACETCHYRPFALVNHKIWEKKLSGHITSRGFNIGLFYFMIMKIFIMHNTVPKFLTWIRWNWKKKLTIERFWYFGDIRAFVKGQGKRKKKRKKQFAR